MGCLPDASPEVSPAKTPSFLAPWFRLSECRYRLTTSYPPFRHGVQHRKIFQPFLARSASVEVLELVWVSDRKHVPSQHVILVTLTVFTYHDVFIQKVIRKCCQRDIWLFNWFVWRLSYNLCSYFGLERLSKCKPLINNPRNADWHFISQELEQIAKLAENFTENRSKLARGCHDDLADTLDQEGSYLHRQFFPCW